MKLKPVYIQLKPVYIQLSQLSQFLKSLSSTTFVIVHSEFSFTSYILLLIIYFLLSEKN